MDKPSIKTLQKRYKLADEAKKGDTIVCPSCCKHILKTHYQKKFCDTKCKDYYWNNVTPNKRNNTTRISPANRAWMENQERKRNDYKYYENFAHPFSTDALGQD